jgi:hypothetical protein
VREKRQEHADMRESDVDSLIASPVKASFRFADAFHFLRSSSVLRKGLGKNKSG